MLCSRRNTTVLFSTAMVAASAALVAFDMPVGSVAQAAPFESGSSGSFGGDSTTTPPTTIPPVDSGNTIVSLTFDDSNADTLAAGRVLTSKGLAGTYFVITGFVGAPGYLTLADLRSLSADGHEIAGHTVGHADLAALPAAEVTRQVCNDRVNLSNWGLPAANFAYPFASMNLAAQSIVADCGYNSARRLGDLKTRFGCENCDYAESTPPRNRLSTRAPAQVDNTWTLEDLQNTVTNAENTGGGWVQLTFHNICADNCSPLAVTPALFEQFATWLAARSDTTEVKTVGQVIGGSTTPAHPGAAVPAPAPGVNGLQNPSLETTGAQGLPDCWSAGGYGTNSRAVVPVTPGRTGTTAQKLTMSAHVDGDGKLIPTLDLGNCAPSVTPGHTYSLRAWYTANTNTQFAVYLRDEVGAWSYWTSSPWFEPADSYTEAEWTTPQIPDGFTGISFGLSLFSDGELITDDYSLYDTIGAPPIGITAPQSRSEKPQTTTTSGPPTEITLFVPGPGQTQPGQPFAPIAGE